MRRKEMGLVYILNPKYEVKWRYGGTSARVRTLDVDFFTFCAASTVSILKQGLAVINSCKDHRSGV